MGANHGRVVRIDDVHGDLQQAVPKLEALNIYNDLELILGDSSDLESITGLRGMTKVNPGPTFDVNKRVR